MLVDINCQIFLGPFDPSDIRGRFVGGLDIRVRAIHVGVWMMAKHMLSERIREICFWNPRNFNYKANYYMAD